MSKLSLSQKKKKLKELKNEVKDFHPLLSELLPKIPRIYRVEYTHGQHEQGADFVLFRTDDAFGKTEHIGLIVKTGKITQSLTKIEEQIDECDEHRYLCNGKELSRIDEIWVVTNESISEHAKKKIYRKFSSRKISFVQDEDLIHIIDNNFENFWHDLPVLISAYLSNIGNDIEKYDNSLSLLPIEVGQFYVKQTLQRKEKSYSSNKKIKNKKKNKSIYEIIDRENKSILVEGEPGYGKSKLLREVAKHYSDQETFIKEYTIPLIVTYRELHNTYKCDIESFIKTKINYSIFDQSDNKIKTLLIIDGFDERTFATQSEEAQLQELVEQSNKIDNLQLLIATRPLSFIEQGKSLSKDIAWYTLNPLSLNGIISFFNNICKKTNISGRIVEDLKKSQIFKQLPKSPIAAILLANLLNENSKELPSNLTELYEKYSELMLGRWDIHKGLQEQKEYDAALCIIQNIANFFIENEITVISIDEAKTFFNDYLTQRNLGIDPEELFKKVTCRSSILQKSINANTVFFKHKTFLEFYYAKYKVKFPDSEFIDERVHSVYWRNTYFFYIGLQKDCADLLEQVLAINPTEPDEKILKILNMADYFLAAFATPYNIVEKHIPKLFIEFTTIYRSIVKKTIDTPISNLPEMSILFLFQALSRGFFSYDFFVNSLEGAIVEILDNDKLDEKTKIYALYFIYVIFVDLERDNPFDNLISYFDKKLPLQIQLALDYEGSNVKEVSSILKKQRKQTNKKIKQASPSMRKFIQTLHKTPIDQVKQ